MDTHIGAHFKIKQKNSTACKVMSQARHFATSLCNKKHSHTTGNEAGVLPFPFSEIVQIVRFHRQKIFFLHFGLDNS